MALIVAIEDHDLMRRLLADMLGRAGNRVLLARDGQEGLDLMESTQGVDLIISDLMLPDMAGLEVIRRLRTKHEQPIIAISGESLASDYYIRAAKLGVCRTLLKPFALSALLTAVDEVLGDSPLQSGDSSTRTTSTDLVRIAAGT